MFWGLEAASRARYHATPHHATPGHLTRYPRRPYIQCFLGHRPLVKILELIILAAGAAFILIQLYSVLGRRVGRQPEDGPARTGAPLKAIDDARPVPPVPVEGAANLTGLAALRARDPSFEPARFVQGSRAAFQTIVKAFAAGDRATLKPLLSPEVMQQFEAVIETHEAAGRSEVVEFLHPPRADLESAAVVGDMARVSVRFLAEYRSRTTDDQGEGIDDQRTAEIWTFERSLKSRDPNWVLIHVDAAEA